MQLFDQLQNWPPLLSAFLKAAGSSDIGTNICISGSASHSRHIKVLQNLIACKGAVNGLINVQLAVISLHRLLNEVSALTQMGLAIHQLTDNPRAKLTNQSECFIRPRTCLSTQTIYRPRRSVFNNDDYQYLLTYCKSSDKSELPLRLALFISPIYLLMPKCLHKLKRRVDFFSLIEVNYQPLYI